MYSLTHGSKFICSSGFICFVCRNVLWSPSNIEKMLQTHYLVKCISAVGFRGGFYICVKIIRDQNLAYRHIFYVRAGIIAIDR